MSMDFEDVMEQAYDLPNGRAKLALLEEAARLADSLGDIEQGYEARSEIVESATFSGYPMKAIVAFSWQLGQFDANPDKFDEYNLLWSYKWVMDKIACFPEISREQINNLLEDMKKRYLEYGYNDRAYYYYGCVLAMKYGEVEQAGRFLQIAKNMESDGMSDCSACEQDQFVEYHVIAGDDEQALKVAKPILNGKMRCEEVPHVTLSKVLLPLYRLGKIEEANQYQIKGYRLIKDNRDYVLQIGEHIRYLTLTDPFQALEIFEKHVSLAMDHENPYDKMMFNAYASALFKRLAEEDVAYQIKLPAGFPYLEEASDVIKLSERFGGMAQETALKMDQRNGNSYYVSYITQL